MQTEKLWAEFKTFIFVFLQEVFCGGTFFFFFFFFFVKCVSVLVAVCRSGMWLWLVAVNAAAATSPVYQRSHWCRCCCWCAFAYNCSPARRARVCGTSANWVNKGVVAIAASPEEQSWFCLQFTLWTCVFFLLLCDSHLGAFGICIIRYTWMVLYKHSVVGLLFFYLFLFIL